jgi:hypothetical protein
LLADRRLAVPEFARGSGQRSLARHGPKRQEVA